MIVLDCSAAIAVVRQSPVASDFKRAVFQEDEPEAIITSTLYSAECASVFRKLVQSKSLTPKEASMAFLTASELVDEFHDVRENCVEALAEGIRLNHSPYDMFYFTLARRYGATLLTCDKALARLCAQEGVSCLCPGA